MPENTVDAASSDIQVRQRVLDELDWEPSVDAANIGVTVKDGVTRLQGTVASYFEKALAVRAVERVAGVRAVADDLEVELPGESRRSDADIARAALDALGWDVSVPDDAIKLSVDDGRVRLSGEVEWEYQRRSAERAIRNLTGVKSVTNTIRITPRVAPKDVRAKITAALHRSAQVEAEKISVAVSGSKVTLRGLVHSWAEKVAAGAAARSAPGVKEVDNLIVVDRG